VFYRWQKAFFENGAAAFERRGDARADRPEKQNAALRAKLAHKDEVIGEILADREQKLAAGREARKARRRERNSTERKEESKLPVAGETDASSAGAQLARDSRPGGDEYRTGGADRSPVHVASVGRWIFRASLVPQENSGVWGAAPGEQSAAPAWRKLLTSVRRLSNSR